jgi:hypothetical protein
MIWAVNGKYEKFIQILIGKPKGKRPLGNPGVDGGQY